MARKALSRNVVKNDDRVNTRIILDKEGFLCQHDNSETTQNIIKGFEDSGLLTFVNFDYGRVNKKEVVEFYLNTCIGDDEITSKVDGKEVTIAEDIRAAFNLRQAFDLDVSTHTFKYKTFKK